MNLDDIFAQSYLNEYREKEQKKIIHSQEDRNIAAQKRKKLAIMEEFLKKFVDLEITVNHRDQYTKNASGFDGLSPQPFTFYEVDSSKKWSPGVSLCFDHPCEVEIAIPNKIEEEGVVVIKVASHHPDAYMLEQKFHNFESACKALARFLSKCTVKIGKDPKKYQKDSFPRKANVTEFPTSNIPDAPPMEKTDKKVLTQKENSDSHISLKKIGEIFSLDRNKDED